MSTSPEGAALVLSGADLQALGAAQQSLLNAVASPAESLRRCGDAMSTLLGTPHAAACLHLDDGWHVGTGSAHFSGWLHEALAGQHDRRPLAFPPHPWNVVSVEVEAGKARGVLCAAATLPHGPEVPAYARARLELLVPMLRACLERSTPAASSLVAALGRLGEPIALYTAEGTTLCHSSAFRRLLRDEPEATRVHAEARLLARHLYAPPAQPGTMTRIVGTRRSRYELHASRFPRHLLTFPAALIHVHASRNRMPSKHRLRQRLGLTEREVEIALLVAEGLTSKEIAVRLSLSPNTVRRHSEKVLEKLGLHTRAGVALALMREG